MIQDPNPKPLKIQHHMKPAMGEVSSKCWDPPSCLFIIICFSINFIHLADTSEDPYCYDRGVIHLSVLYSLSGPGPWQYAPLIHHRWNTVRQRNEHKHHRIRRQRSRVRYRGAIAAVGWERPAVSALTWLVPSYEELKRYDLLNRMMKTGGRTSFHKVHPKALVIIGRPRFV